MKPRGGVGMQMEAPLCPKEGAEMREEDRVLSWEVQFSPQGDPRKGVLGRARTIHFQTAKRRAEAEPEQRRGL